MNFPNFLKIISFFVIIIFHDNSFEELRIFILQDVPQFELTLDFFL